MTDPLSQTRTDRRSEIAEAALRVLAREGHAALTARKVAAEAKLALGHISYHFNGMDEVLAAAYQRLSDRLRAASDSLNPQASAMERLTAFLHAGFSRDFLTPSHIRTRIDLWSASASHPAVAETERALYAHYRAQLTDLLTPLAAADHIPALTDTIMATLDGLWLDWMRRQDPQAVRNGLLTLIEMVRKAKA